MNKKYAFKFFFVFRTFRLNVSQRLKIGSSILVCALSTVVFSQSARANTQENTLEQLRQRYHQAHATFTKTKQYGKVYDESLESGHKLITALLNHWVTLPEGSAKATVVRQEIRTVCSNMAGKPLTVRRNKEKSFLARVIWPRIADDGIIPAQAAFMAELIEPQMSIRMNDKAAIRGDKTEPIGWDVQAAYALALIRSGNYKQAHNEINILTVKVGISHGFNPKGRLDNGSKTETERYESYTDYVQLCQSLLALLAAVSNDYKSALRIIEVARAMQHTISPKATPLIAEVNRRIQADQK